MTVIVAQVSFEHLDEHVQVRFHRLDVLTELIEPRVRAAELFVRALELLVRALLRRVQMAHDRAQTDDPFGHPVGLRREFFKIFRELRLLMQQELTARLDDYLYSLRGSLGADAFPREAAHYLDAWASDDHAWLRKYYPADSDEPHAASTV